MDTVKWTDYKLCISILDRLGKWNRLHAMRLNCALARKWKPRNKLMGYFKVSKQAMISSMLLFRSHRVYTRTSYWPNYKLKVPIIYYWHPLRERYMLTLFDDVWKLAQTEWTKWTFLFGPPLPHRNYNSKWDFVKLM